MSKIRPANIPPYPTQDFRDDFWYWWSATRLAVMCESGLEEAEAVVSAALGSAQEWAESHLLAAGALGAMRRQGGSRAHAQGASAKFVDAPLPLRISNPLRLPFRHPGDANLLTDKGSLRRSPGSASDLLRLA